MRHTDFNASSKFIQNLFIEQNEQENFDQFMHKQANFGRVVKPFTDSTNHIQINIHQVGQTSGKHKLSKLNHTINHYHQDISQSKQVPQASFTTFIKKSSNLCLLLDSQDSSQELEDKPVANKANNSHHQKLKKLHYDTSSVLRKMYPQNNCPENQKHQQTKKQESQLKETGKEKQQKQVISSQNKIIQINNGKRNNLLVNFECESDSEGNSSSDEQIVINKAIDECQQKNAFTQKAIDGAKNSNRQRKNNILLNDFGSSSQDENQSNTINLNSSCVKCDSKKSLTQENLHSISIPQFVKMTSEVFIYAPVPQNCIVQTIIKRYQNSSNNVLYQMFDSNSYKSILKVKKCSEGFEIFSSKESVSVLNLNAKTLRENQQTSCALIDSNFFGTEFNCYKFNRNNEKPNLNKLNRMITIQYETNLFGLKGPRKMQAFIPTQNNIVRGENNLRQIYQSETQKKLSNLKVERFINKTPKWNSQFAAFVLNFYGRATISSVKNFIITKEEANSPTTLPEAKNHQFNYVIFGKVQRNIFNLDIKHPFNLIQGLALALSSFDKKIGCE